MKLFAEIRYFFQHKTPVKLFYMDENEIHENFLNTLKDNGKKVAEAEKMVKKIEISRET